MIFGLEEENPLFLKRFGGQWIHAAASRRFIIVIDQDGKAIACCDEGDYPAPRLPVDIKYVYAAGGWDHGILIRSDGKFEVFNHGWCIPLGPPRLQYVQAAAGAKHTILISSNGYAFAFGANDNNQCCVCKRIRLTSCCTIIRQNIPQTVRPKIIRVWSIGQLTIGPAQVIRAIL